MQNKTVKIFLGRKKIYLTNLSLTVLFLSFFVFSDEGVSNIDTVFRFSIMIEAKETQVWPFLFHIDQWKYSVNKVENVKHSIDKENGVAAVYYGKSNEAAGLFIKTLRIKKNKHYSFSLYTPENKFVGFAAYNLEAEGKGTRLTYDVYLHEAKDKISEEQSLMIKNKYVEAMENRQIIELASLKDLVEKSR